MDAEGECARYDAVIKSVGGVDLQLLGIGHDGHIGFNEPGEAFELGTHCVDLKPETIEANKRFFDGNEDLVPKQAYTMAVSYTHLPAHWKHHQTGAAAAAHRRRILFAEKLRITAQKTPLCGRKWHTRRYFCLYCIKF